MKQFDELFLVTARFRRTRGLAVTFCFFFRQTLTQLVPPGGGTTVWRRREEGRGVVPPCGGRGRGGEGWYHRVEEEGEEERGGTTVWRKREERRLFSICEITTCLIRGSMG